VDVAFESGCGVQTFGDHRFCLHPNILPNDIPEGGLIPLGHPSTWEPYRVAPFEGYQGMIRFLDGVRNLNDDAMILIDGLEGSGKSTLAFQIAKKLEPAFNSDTDLIIDYEDWEEVYDLGEKRVFILDEGGDLMFSRDSMKGENKMVIRIFQMARIFNHIIIVCAPNIHWVDLYVREHRALIYGHAHKNYVPGGVQRGLSSFHWPKRRFDYENGEWKASWDRVFDARFQGIPQTLRSWKDYEIRKRNKVQLRQMELKKALRR
jgi:ABC-type dipeptide/oligopeptide/nickel transport system ATPase component